MRTLFSPRFSERAARLSLVGLAFAGAVLYDIFFWQLDPGLGFTIFALALIAAIVLTAGLAGHVRHRSAYLLLLPLVILGATRSLYSNDFVAVAVPVAFGVLLLTFVILLLTRNPHKYRFHFSRVPLLRSPNLPLLRLPEVFRDLLGADKTRTRAIVWGVIIAVPLLAAFTALFAGADAIFSEWLKALAIPEALWRTLRTVILTGLFSGILYALVHPEHILSAKIHAAKKLETVLVSTVLILINGLFAIFVAIQIKYLFGSATYVLKNGLTFADYARNGFFQLVWVMVLAALILIVVYRSAAVHGHRPFTSALQILLIVQVGIVAASALRRMNLYQTAYGFTVLRLYVEWFIYFVFTLLAFAGLAVLGKISFSRFVHVSLCGAVLALTAVGAVNVDRQIADENVRRFALEKQTVDLEYLARLSADAVPGIVRLSEPEALKRLSVEQVLRLNQILADSAADVAAHADWRSVTLGHLAAADAAARLAEPAHAAIREAIELDRQYQRTETQLNADGQARPLAQCPFNQIYYDCARVESDGVEFWLRLTSSPEDAAAAASAASLAVYRADLVSGFKSYRLLAEKALATASGESRFSLSGSGLVLEARPAERAHFLHPVELSESGVIFADSRPLSLSNL